MPHPVFISYARSDSAAEAKALADALNGEAYLDTESMQEGTHFPTQLLDALLAARVVVVFASEHYLARRFCRAEMRLALHAGADDASHIVVALDEKPQDVLDSLPERAANANWPQASETSGLVTQIRQRLVAHPKSIGELIPRDEADDMAQLFLAEASIPAPRSLSGIRVSFPIGFAPQSIGRRFVGRADDMRELHGILAQSSGGGACLSTRIAAGAGFGKTRLAIEYVYRYGERYSGGVFWINAASAALDDEFWRILKVIDPATPEISVLRAQNVSISGRLADALRGVGKPILCVADNIPEAGPGVSPRPLPYYCPGLGAATLLATSRQNTYSAGVENLPIDKLNRPSAILLLKKDVPSAASLNREEWSRVADWVGDLPVVLDLLNRLLAAKAFTPKRLLARCDASATQSTTEVLAEMAQALQGQVAESDLVGIADALLLSYENLDKDAQNLARILAQLAPAPIPEELLDALPEELATGSARVALQSRHFVTSAEGDAYGVMHRLTADFLRSLPDEKEHASYEAACAMVAEVMTIDHCDNPKCWPLMKLCNPHTEALFKRGLQKDATAIWACTIGHRTGWFAQNIGDYTTARRIRQRVVDTRKRISGEGDPNTLAAMSNLALTLRALGELKVAHEQYERVLEIKKRILGEEHPDTLISTNNLAEALRGLGEFQTAREHHERVLEIRTRIFGEEDPGTLTSMNNLANTLSDLGEFHAAQEQHERVLEICTRVFGEEHPNTLTSMNNLAGTLHYMGKLDHALELFRTCLVLRCKVLGETHPHTVATSEWVTSLEKKRQYPGTA